MRSLPRSPPGSRIAARPIAWWGPSRSGGRYSAWIASAYLQGSKSSAPSSETSNGTTVGQGGTTYTTANLNLRTGASLGDKVSVIAKKGAKLSLTGKVSGNYAQVTYKGKTLWASLSYLAKTAPSAEAKLPKAKGQKRGTTALMIRTTSGKDFKSLGDAPKGTIFDVTGATENGVAEVIWMGAARWVNAAYLVDVDSLVETPKAPAAPKTSVQYATAVLNIWSASSGTSYSGEIPRGSEVNVTGTVKDGRAQIVPPMLLITTSSRPKWATPAAKACSVLSHCSRSASSASTSLPPSASVAASSWT